MDVNSKSDSKPAFKDVWNDIQSKMGAKPPEQRQAKKTLDKDDFLRIMISQMKNQDPTKPFEADKLAAEIAQITSVEQMGNVSLALKKLTSNNRPLEKMAMTNMIGKNIVFDRSRFPHQENQTDKLSFNLPAAAKTVKVLIVNEKGQEVYENDLGAMKEGANSFVWNGKLSNHNSAPAGTYTLRIEAHDEEGRLLNIKTQTQAKVIGVSYEGENPVLLVGSGNKFDKVDMASVAQIADGDVDVEANKGAKMNIKNAPIVNANVASANVDEAENESGKLTSPYQKPQDHSPTLSLSHVPTRQAPPLSLPAESGSEEKGFPNGLQEMKPTSFNETQGGVEQ